MAAMKGLLHPLGPLPPGVYWRRRLVVLVLLLALTAMIVALVGQPGRRAVPPDPASGAAVSGPLSPTPSLSSMPVSPSPTPSEVEQSPAGTASTEQPVSPTPTPTVQPLAVCSPADLALAITGPGQLRVRQTASFALTLANPGGDCLHDFSQHPLTVSISSGSDAIWSTLHCPEGLPTGVHQLGVAPLLVDVGWSLRRSAPGCVLGTALLKAGTYVVVASLDDGPSSRLVLGLRS